MVNRCRGITIRNGLTLFEVLITKRNAVRVRKLADSIGLASGTGLVALDVVARQENTIARDDFTGFQKRDIADDDLL